MTSVRESGIGGWVSGYFAELSELDPGSHQSSVWHNKPPILREAAGGRAGLLYSQLLHVPIATAKPFRGEAEPCDMLPL